MEWIKYIKDETIIPEGIICLVRVLDQPTPYIGCFLEVIPEKPLWFAPNGGGQLAIEPIYILEYCIVKDSIGNPERVTNKPLHIKDISMYNCEFIRK